MFVQKLIIVLALESKKYLQLEVCTSGQLIIVLVHEHFDTYNRLFYNTNTSSTIIKAIICCSVEFSAIMCNAYSNRRYNLCKGEKEKLPSNKANLTLTLQVGLEIYAYESSSFFFATRHWMKLLLSYLILGKKTELIEQECRQETIYLAIWFIYLLFWASVDKVIKLSQIKFKIN